MLKNCLLLFNINKNKRLFPIKIKYRNIKITTIIFMPKIYIGTSAVKYNDQLNSFSMGQSKLLPYFCRLLMCITERKLCIINTL